MRDPPGGGDLDARARRSRAILDSAGLTDVRIVAGGGLDEYGVDRLVRSGTPIDVYAVGTRLGVADPTVKVGPKCPGAFLAPGLAWGYGGTCPPSRRGGENHDHARTGTAQ